MANERKHKKQSDVAPWSFNALLLVFGSVVLRVALTAIVCVPAGLLAMFFGFVSGSGRSSLTISIFVVFLGVGWSLLPALGHHWALLR